MDNGGQCAYMKATFTGNAVGDWWTSQQKNNPINPHGDDNKANRNNEEQKCIFVPCNWQMYTTENAIYGGSNMHDVIGLTLICSIFLHIIQVYILQLLNKFIYF